MDKGRLKTALHHNLLGETGLAQYPFLGNVKGSAIQHAVEEPRVSMRPAMVLLTVHSFEFSEVQEARRRSGIGHRPMLSLNDILDVQREEV